MSENPDMGHPLSVEELSRRTRATCRRFLPQERDTRTLARCKPKRASRILIDEPPRFFIT